MGPPSRIVSLPHKLLGLCMGFLSGLRSFVWVSVQVWGISDVSFVGPSSLAPCSVTLVFPLPPPPKKCQVQMFDGDFLSISPHCRCWETQNSVRVLPLMFPHRHDQPRLHCRPPGRVQGPHLAPFPLPHWCLPRFGCVACSPCFRVGGPPPLLCLCFLPLPLSSLPPCLALLSGMVFFSRSCSVSQSIFRAAATAMLCMQSVPREKGR